MTVYPESTLLLELCEERYFRLNTKIRHEHTRQQYRIAMGDLARSLGHPPTIGDLSDDNVALMIRSLIEKGLAPRTINGRRDRVHCLWTWLAKRGHLSVWPTTPAVDEPHRTPRAWSEPQLRRLFNAASLETGRRKGVPKWLYWQVLLSLLWDTSERIGAVLAARWEHVDLESRWLHIPAEIRKGRKRDMAYQLSPETVGHLRTIKKYAPDFLLPSIYNHTYLWTVFERLLKNAGLPQDRSSKFHRIRKSVASHFEAAGGDAQRLLGHSSRRITEAYLDPSIVVPPQAVEKLFRPDR